MELINDIASLLEKNLFIGVLSISLFVNVFLFRLYLKTNKQYIDILMDNIKITERINAIMGKLKVNSEIFIDRRGDVPIPIELSSKEDKK